MELKNLGEFGLIAEIKRKFAKMVPSAVEGIGDDCAVIPKNKASSYVITTDMLVEGKHFMTDRITPFELGFKSLAVNLSDIASMGATPRFSFLSIAVPPTIDEKWCEEFIEGYHSLSAKYRVPLLGGDTTAANDGSITINVTAIGEAKNIHIKRRNMAQIGDIIAVSTTLGDSAAALKLMLNGEEPNSKLKEKHNMPRPHIREGIWLGEHSTVHAMMDISDGVSSDINHICELSSVGADIFTDLIPYSAEFLDVCGRNKWNILDLSLSGGEDYGLLLTIEKESFKEIRRNMVMDLDTILYPIGEITKSGIRYLNKNKKEIKQSVGFRHF